MKRVPFPEGWHLDSSWNWLQQSTLLMFYNIAFGYLTTVDREITARCIAIMNRVDPELVTYMQYYIDQCDPTRGENYKLAKQFGQQLIDNCRKVLGQPPLYKDVTFPTAAHTEVTVKKAISSTRGLFGRTRRSAKSRRIASKRYTKVSCDRFANDQNLVLVLKPLGNADLHLNSCVLKYPVSPDKVPLLHLKHKVGTNWEYSSNLTGVYLDILHEIATSGTTFKGKNALLTRVGKSRDHRVLPGHFPAFGSKGSALTVVLFNQGSKQDVEALVDYIYSILGLNLDYILPFTAVPENGHEIDGLDDKSELAHRIMLVNLLRLLGAVKIKKASCHFIIRPTQVILPLSPNHGLFGNDGLYSESKISLETLFNRWNSES
ncbi:hypothetical protein A0H81_03485 [Grifola frondosa]|uniref:Fatty acid synthase type I helical domain-containing protein n=1 Tax=Grifola frondosa TaxID=5627 RepID=A0A1C7MKA8_GRIFR|nr:hypothetical protein A0H81_03485 [Grifola frondosa]